MVSLPIDYNILAYIRPTLEWRQCVWSLQSLCFWCCYNRPGQNFLGGVPKFGGVPPKGAWIKPWPTPQKCCWLYACDCCEHVCILYVQQIMRRSVARSVDLPVVTATSSWPPSVPADVNDIDELSSLYARNMARPRPRRVTSSMTSATTRSTATVPEVAQNR